MSTPVFVHLFPFRCRFPRPQLATIALLLSSLSLFAPVAHSATVNAPSASFADVSAKVAAANRGDIINVPPGTVSWGSSTLTLSRGVSLLGAGKDKTIITGSGPLVTILPDASAITNDEVIRVEGFTFDGGNTASYIMQVYGAGATGPKPFNKLAVGNNRFRNGTTVTSNSAAIMVKGQVRGAIFRNVFDRCNVILKNLGNNDTVEWANGHFPFAYGNEDNLFFEANTIQFSSAFAGQDPGWVENGQGARAVFRYNTWDLTNSSLLDIFDVHGFQNFPGNGQTGTMITEYYGNTLIGAKGYRWIAHRGSWGMYHNNVGTGTSSGAIAMMQYGPASGQAGGSGCTADVPGAKSVFKPEINNTYVFNNTMNGGVKNMAPWFTDGCGVSGENVGYWNFNASFNGSAGIGRGTSAPGGNPTVGVGFWVATNPSPTVDPSVIQNGTFYKCVTPGRWTAYYKPFTYPHPLSQGSGASGGASPTPSVAPSPSATPVSTPGTTPTPTPSSNLTFDSSSGVISAPFAVNSDGTISQAVQTIDPAQSGQALYSFNIVTAGEYVVAAQVNCPDGGSNSFFVNLDGDPTEDMTWYVPVTSGWQVRTVSWGTNAAPHGWTLQSGIHQLIVRGREPNSKLGPITIAPAAPGPNNVRIVGQ